MVYRLKLFVLIFIPAANLAMPAYSQMASNKEELPYNLVLVFKTGLAVPQNPTAFFDTYNNILEGDKTTLKARPSLGASLYFDLYDKYRIDISGSYMFADLNDFYTDQIYNSHGEITYRYITSDIFIKEFPVILNILYMPFRDYQYKTYIGIGAGISIGSIEWSEIINSPIPRDDRQGGEQYNDFFIRPAAKLTTGLELAFDKNFRALFLGSLIIEVNYGLIFTGVDVFKNVSPQFDDQPSLEDRYNLFPGYLSFTAGVSFNLGGYSNLP